MSSGAIPPSFYFPFEQLAGVVQPMAVKQAVNADEVEIVGNSENLAGMALFDRDRHRNNDQAARRDA